MLKQFVRAVLLVTIALVASHDNAQSAQRFKIQVPFPFVLNGQTLPAGRYIVERTNPARPNVLTVKMESGRISLVVLTQRVEKDNPSTESSLIFIQREGKHYLFQVWNVGAMNGRQVPFALEKQTSDQQRRNIALVTLSVKDH